MRQAGVQVLTHTLRLPDEQQAAALRWLAFSRNTVNTVLRGLWPRLAEVCGMPVERVSGLRRCAQYWTSGSRLSDPGVQLFSKEKQMRFSHVRL
jgi:hypothetical protein